MIEDNNISEKDRTIADYAMACELVCHISSYVTEDSAIDNIMHLFRTLCAPSSIIYLSIVEDHPTEVRTFPEKTADKTVLNDLVENFKDDYALTASGKGFRLKIRGREGVIGLIEIDGLLFPEYKNHYLNLSLTIASALGLSISNSRIYQALVNVNTQLETFKKISIGRELKMIELKEEINTLVESMGQPIKYKIPNKVNK
ncbi:hypothetical protein [Candidatus Magnetominusculus xianensis]|uniref:Multi-sensor signal transduction histidine kinase n=1 Tax=Candidatus Magnetominusculus xianensis TaxID=1748249 RepID=A0ABR5SH46_9BACT|nr:hypothetical protein [Candidatus Magnetominusculus xianensis]KWT82917.1 multi-sensor signal transduction histidine kinase [Candidatus Magnetominusculus xianensis]MBF0405319.1 hypothetical protein [Nitrospirota bacterium]